MADRGPNAPAVAQLLSSGRVVGPWVLDPEQSSVTFAVKHFWGLITVRGRFHGVSGHGEVSQSGAVCASISIDAASLDTGNRRRDDHLRSADFFDADTHPSVVIATTRVEPRSGDESWSVGGGPHGCGPYRAGGARTHAGGRERTVGSRSREARHGPDPVRHDVESPGHGLEHRRARRRTFASSGTIVTEGTLWNATSSRP